VLTLKLQMFTIPDRLTVIETYKGQHSIMCAAFYNNAHHK